MIRAVLASVLSLWAAVTAAQAEISIQQVTSPGGIEAWLVEEHSIPFTALEIRIRGGANLDREGKRGSVNLMTALLEEGSGDMDARAFQEAREALAASFGFDASDDAVSLSASWLSENRDAGVDLLRQALVEPRFDEDAIERVRAQLQSIIASNAQDPGSIASDTFMAEAFPGHPYGSDINGTAESLAGLTRDDLVQAHRDTLVKDRVYVGAVGDINPEELGALLDRLLGDLPQEGPALPAPPATTVTGGTTVVNYPSPQAQAIFGQVGLPRDDPDYFAAYVLNHVLGGGGFESRLMDEVREKRGLTYGIGTSLVDKDYADLWMGSVASDNRTIGEAIALVREIWSDVAANGVTQEELDAAKTFITGEYPLRFDGNAQIAGILVGMQMIGLPPDYVVNRNGYVEAVTLDDVRRVAARLMDPEGLRVVVVGQPEGLEPDAPAPAPAPAPARGTTEPAAATP
ncbi:M16 family metallopeptidase [Rubellimicrobium aerolatum]|uniref:M16 family metallopeptidase n=1 Tax=Rubellimicrobium aerolatum TaxID=490979 RepID=A0ABW0SH96_9RHOB|nr:pitrilysin family protein [Rubellimicrobium aerolatum]MBP1806652.1 zinc protease [Rubellimicrobium aerolatum]